MSENLPEREIVREDEYEVPDSDLDEGQEETLEAEDSKETGEGEV